MKPLKLIYLFLLIPFFSFGQVTNVDLKTNLDPVNGIIEVYIVINEGSATSIAERVQFNSQISFRTPADVSIEVDESFMPLVDNFNYNGIGPIRWKVTQILEGPSDFPDHNFYSISPQCHCITKMCML